MQYVPTLDFSAGVIEARERRAENSPLGNNEKVDVIARIIRAATLARATLPLYFDAPTSVVHIESLRRSDSFVYAAAIYRRALGTKSRRIDGTDKR